MIMMQYWSFEHYIIFDFLKYIYYLQKIWKYVSIEIQIRITKLN